MTPEERVADWFTLPPAARTKAWLTRQFRKAIEEAIIEHEISRCYHRPSQIEVIKNNDSAKCFDVRFFYENGTSKVSASFKLEKNAIKSAVKMKKFFRLP